MTHEDLKKFNWTVTKTYEGKLNMLEIKFLRNTCHPICVNAECRVKYNDEFYSLYTEPNMVEMIKIGRLRWLGHIAMMEDNVPCIKINFSQPECSRK